MSDREIELELPDGTRMSAPAGSTPLDVARRIGPRLADAALAARLGDAWVDVRAPIPGSGPFRILTARDEEAGCVIRHSAEHVMADAVQRLWPGTQIDVGRADHSEKFQYDLRVAERITPEDFERIEAEMRRIVEEDREFTREELTREQAAQLLRERGEELKLSRLDDIPVGAPITLYRDGDFVDVCRGPHVQRTGQIGAFKLLEVSGSYWRGDERNEMLQRVYGTAFAKKKELAAYLERIEQARRRDHRRLGQELGLFQFHEWAPGAPFYLPKGVALFNGLVDYLRGLYRKYGYDEVVCPQLFDAELFKVSGHYENFRDDMFWMRDHNDTERGLKPMNCPGHCLIFRSTKRSYRELPLRFAEFSRLHRNERHGSLHGMTRVSAMSQDDGHIFCEPEQLRDEVDRLMEMTSEVYRDLGLSGIELCVATRPPEKFIGEIADWEHAEQLLCEAVERAGFECKLLEGEGAFYGPKIEYHFYDALGRDWQLQTIQLDMGMPERFGLRYIGRDGAEHRPAMIHRAIFGSIERFLGVYIEHTAGDFPLWLAPVQVAVLPVSEKFEEYARKVVDVLVEGEIRAAADDRNETLGYRIRDAEHQKIPCIAVVGEREQQDGTVTVRRRHHEEQTSMNVDEFRSNMREEVRTRGIS
jgi:threonyl-tRNA synthetase